jgi:hypothetical protein
MSKKGTIPKQVEGGTNHPYNKTQQKNSMEPSKHRPIICLTSGEKY